METPPPHLLTPWWSLCAVSCEMRVSFRAPHAVSPSSLIFDGPLLEPLSSVCSTPSLLLVLKAAACYRYGYNIFVISFLAFLELIYETSYLVSTNL